MNCKRARLEIALWVGNDLDEASVESLQRHIAECSPCRNHWEKLRSCHQRLKSPSLLSDESLSRGAVKSMHDSVWPDLLVRLPARNAETQPVEFNGWFPAMAVIAASIAIAVFWQNDSMNRFSRAAVQPVETGTQLTQPYVHPVGTHLRDGGELPGEPGREVANVFAMRRSAPGGPIETRSLDAGALRRRSGVNWLPPYPRTAIGEIHPDELDGSPYRFPTH